MDSRPGTYALRLEATMSQSVRVGKLGTLELCPGHYIYIGSAFGPGGLRARVNRHAVRDKRLHWHIDYVRCVTKLAEVWYTYDTMRREHQWAEMLMNLAQTCVPLLGFGASDCTCTSHLVHLHSGLTVATFQAHVQSQISDHAPILRQVCRPSR